MTDIRAAFPGGVKQIIDIDISITSTNASNTQTVASFTAAKSFFTGVSWYNQASDYGVAGILEKTNATTITATRAVPGAARTTRVTAQLIELY